MLPLAWLFFSDSFGYLGLFEIIYCGHLIENGPIAHVFISNWWNCLGKFRWCNFIGGSAALEWILIVKKIPIIPSVFSLAPSHG